MLKRAARILDNASVTTAARVCDLSWRHPFAWLGIVLLISVPAWWGVRALRLDTNLKRLLPEHSRAVLASEQLEEAVGDGGYFSVLFEGPEDAVLEQVQTAVAEQIAQLPGVSSVDYRYPVDFIERYRYTLLSTRQLERLRDHVWDLEEEVNPFVEDLGTASDESAGKSAKRDDDTDRDLDRILRYSRLPQTHRNAEGTVFGMIVRTQEGVRNLASLQRLYRQIDEVAASQAAAHELWYGIAGNLRNRVEEFDSIVEDLRLAGTVSALAIVLTLAISFWSLRILPVVVFPLALGLYWSFALVPVLVGELNTITSFLGMVMFGMGVDYAIHLVKRYRVERTYREPREALRETFASTGRSVLVSGLTTSLGLALLAISDFRGFSDFGIVGASSVLAILAAMLLVMPATLAAGERLRLITSRLPASRRARSLVPGTAATTALGGLVVIAAVLTAGGLRFDYDFSNLSAATPELEPVRERHSQIYSGFSAPAALYVVSGAGDLDALLEGLRERQEHAASAIGNVTSIRDYAPEADDYAARLALIEEVQESLSGRWTRRVEDPDQSRLIDDVRAFDPPAAPAGLGDVPDSLRDAYLARDGSGDFIVGIDTAGRSRDGLMTIAFVRELYGLDLPDSVRGPTGDKPVLAEILSMVISESPLIIVLTILGVLALVFVDQCSLRAALWIMMPLLAGLVLTLGIMVVLGWKLNFFNMVVLPTLLGLGVDHGVHYYRRWRELSGNVVETQRELVEPLTVCSLTTLMGYVGMSFAHHPGLRAISHLAVIGLASGWATAIWLLPGALAIRRRLAVRRGSAGELSRAGTCPTRHSALPRSS